MSPPEREGAARPVAPSPGGPQAIVLASASPTRRSILAAGGIEVIVEPSTVEEFFDDRPPSELALALARLKARDVAGRRREGLVLGCDSLLDVEGRSFGKPHTREQAAERWRSMRGSTGVLVTGHVLIDASSGEEVDEVVSTVVRFGHPSEEEIDRYVRSGEPLDKAGSFTLEGRSAPFLEGIDGDPGNVRGLSLPALGRLLAHFGRSITDYWTT